MFNTSTGVLGYKGLGLRPPTRPSIQYSLILYIPHTGTGNIQHQGVWGGFNNRDYCKGLKGPQIREPFERGFKVSSRI